MFLASHTATTGKFELESLVDICYNNCSSTEIVMKKFNIRFNGRVITVIAKNAVQALKLKEQAKVWQHYMA